MKLIYFAYGNVSVFESQVLALFNYYIGTKKVSEIIFIIGLKTKSESVKYLNKGINEKIKIMHYLHYPQYPFIEWLTIKSIIKSLKKVHNIEDYIIHVRNDVLSHYVYKSLMQIKIYQPKIVADVRGAGFEQIKEYSNIKGFAFLLKYLQRKRVFKTLSKIKNISVVSDSLKKYVINNINNSAFNITINSCLASENFQYNNQDRFEIRKKLGVNKNEKLFVLATGGNNTWQNTNETINALVKKNYKVLNLSRCKIEFYNVINLFIPYNEVPKYLSASDIAIIWREKSITNKVASPVKFSEYICCGLPVITNDSIDLISNFVKENNCGSIINSIDEIDEELINSITGIDRQILSKIGRENFGIEKIASQYISFYKSL